MFGCLDREMWGAAMGWRQGQSYSEDLRGRVLAAVDGGMAARTAARMFRAESRRYSFLLIKDQTLGKHRIM